MSYKINEEVCVGCGACEGVCPVSAILPTDSGKYKIDDNLCINCGACTGVCPVNAISE
ncbi:4Fe-4S binding protein [uncultured Ilyobacter sp.]|uniref:4Fe-4S binding protein n=1 Tax=uncultured Ilyobacter sp. TaxID=544433 RepID=UPI0029C83A02|nr:4Fe-4S binding protein [uncultured Ilyobacter sp.]